MSKKKKINIEGLWWKTLILVIFVVALVYAIYRPSYERFTERAYKFYKMGEYEKASIEFLKAASEYGDMIGGDGEKLKAQIKAAEIYEIHIHNYPSAIKIYEGIFSRKENDEYSLTAGEKLLSIYFDILSKPSQGIAIGQELAKKYPRSDRIGHWKNLIIKGYIDGGEYQQAKAEADEFLEAFPRHELAPRIAFMRAEALSLLERYDEAISAFSKISLKYPLSDDARLVDFEIGNCQMETDQLQKALLSYEKALSVYPNPMVVQIRMAAAREKIKARQEGRYTRFRQMMEKRYRDMSSKDKKASEDLPVRPLKDKGQSQSQTQDAPPASQDDDPETMGDLPELVDPQDIMELERLRIENDDKKRTEPDENDPFPQDM